MLVDGKKARLLATNAQNACWSPDGKRVACITGADNSVTILPANGKSPKEMVVGNGEDPVFSHDGKHLLFTQFEQDGDYVTPTTLAIIHFGAKSGEFTISELPADKRTMPESDAVFSPDDTAGIFARQTGIFRMNIDRTGETQLTTGQNDRQPAISPDGRWLYFLRLGQLCRMKLDGGEVETLTGEDKGIYSFRLIPHYDAVWLQAADRPKE